LNRLVVAFEGTAINHGVSDAQEKKRQRYQDGGEARRAGPEASFAVFRGRTGRANQRSRETSSYRRSRW